MLILSIGKAGRKQSYSQDLHAFIGNFEVKDLWKLNERLCSLDREILHSTDLRCTRKQDKIESKEPFYGAFREIAEIFKLDKLEKDMVIDKFIFKMRSRDIQRELL